MSALRLHWWRAALLQTAVAACGPTLRAPVVPPAGPLPRDTVVPPPPVAVVTFPVFDGATRTYALRLETRSVEEATMRRDSTRVTYQLTLAPTPGSASAWQVRATSRRSRPDSADAIDSLPIVFIDDEGRMGQIVTPSPCRVQPVSPLFLRQVMYRRPQSGNAVLDSLSYETCTPGGRSRVSSTVRWTLPADQSARVVEGRIEGRVVADSTRGFPMRLEGVLAGTFTQWRDEQVGAVDSVTGVLTLGVTTRANQLTQVVQQRVLLRANRLP